MVIKPVLVIGLLPIRLAFGGRAPGLSPGAGYGGEAMPSKSKHQIKLSAEEVEAARAEVARQ